MTAQGVLRPTRSSASGSGAGLVGLAGIGSFLFLPIVGRISVLEILAILCFPLTVRGLIRQRGTAALALATALMVGAVVASAFFNDASISTTAKAVANYSFVAIDTGFLIAIIGTEEHGHLHRLVVAAGASEIVGAFVTPSAASSVDPWKFGLGPGLTLLVLALARLEAETPIRRRIWACVLLALAGTHVALGSRSLGMMTLIAAGVASLPQRRAERTSGAVRTASAVIAVGVVVGVIQLYGFLAASGVFGASAAMKYRAQAGDFGLLLGARKDIVFMAFNGLHHPWLGLGPGARGSPGALFAAEQWIVGHHYAFSPGDYFYLVLNPTLTLHSVVFGAVVVAGMLALPFAIQLVRLVARALTITWLKRDPLLVFVSMTAAVHLMLSPLGDTTRFPIALAIACGAVLAGQPTSVDTK